MLATISGPKTSPWGKVDSCKEICEGAWFVGTPRHGGIKLDRKRNASVPEYMRRDGGWYEEDCDWCIPVIAIRDVLQGIWRKEGETDDQVLESAMDTLLNWHPHSYAQWTGELLHTLEGRSYMYDKQLFKERNANNLVVISAFGSWHKDVPEGLVGVIATKGGQRDAKVQHCFYVDQERYEQRGERSYVITPEDCPWSGPDR